MTNTIISAPPIAKKIPYEMKNHGVTRVDPYFWMRDKDDPDTIAYLTEENEWTEQEMESTTQLQEQLYEELVGRIEEDDKWAPYRYGDFIYYSKIEKGQNYRIYCRAPVEDSTAEEIVLDCNELAKDCTYFELGLLDVSPDGKKIAYAVDTEGDEEYNLHFLDLATRKALSSPIEKIAGEGEWDASSKVFFYTIQDEAKRPHKIMRHVLGSDSSTDTELYYEEDPLFYVSIYKSQDYRYIFALSISKETSEISTFPANAENPTFEITFPRRKNIRYFLDHHEGEWIIRTNENALDFKIISTPVSNHTWENAQIIRPHREGLRLNTFVVLKNYYIFFEKENGLDRLRIWNLKEQSEHFIEMPESVYAIEEGTNAEYDTEIFQFSYSSPIRPATVYNYNLATKTKTPVKVSRVPSGHDSDMYTAYREFATAEDGTRIPITIFHKKSLQRNGDNFVYLYGYGSYGATVDPSFRRGWLTWLQRDFVVAIAHPRGSGLLGEDWYRSGKFLQKKNTFTDFIASAEYLIKEKFTNPQKMVIQGGSAGGLLIGAVLNLRPDLFRVAVAEVPFVDVVSTMLDASLPLTTFEYEEWGNPEEEEFFNYMVEYSPYDNVRAQSYPSILITAGLNDPRVPYWEAAKWTAKLRTFNQNENATILLKTNMDAGHMGASGRYEYLKEAAFDQAFILKQLNLN